MNKKIFLIIAVAILVVSSIALVACTDGANYKVSIAQAKEIAMSHTGVSTDQIEAATVLIEEQGDGAYYVVEFHIEGVKYTYRVNTENGDIEKIAVNDQPVEDKTHCPNVPAADRGSYITREEAVQKALEAVGLTVEQVAGRIETDLDFDRGQYLYEVEFIAEGKEYEVELVATTGEVFKVNVDQITYVEPAGTAYIGVTEAKRIALEEVNLAEDQVVFVEVELEKHRGTHVYEVEFTYQGSEYKFKINATTGAIIHKNHDGQGPAQNTEGLISLDTAKEIALASAGFTAQEVYFDQADTKLECERGKYIYEVKFTVGGYEYEYEIDATTGDILEIDKELED